MDQRCHTAWQCSQHPTAGDLYLYHELLLKEYANYKISSNKKLEALHKISYITYYCITVRIS